MILSLLAQEVDAACGPDEHSTTGSGSGAGTDAAEPPSRGRGAVMSPRTARSDRP